MHTLLGKWRFLTIMLTALGLGPAMGHLLELPAKVTFDGPKWLDLLHTLYPPAFGKVGGIFEVSAVLAVLGLCFLVRHRHPARKWTVVGAFCLVASHAAFWIWVAPVNEIMGPLSPEALPENWRALRNQWEYTHAARAVMQGLGLGALIGSLLVEIPAHPVPRER